MTIYEINTKLINSEQQVVKLTRFSYAGMLIPYIKTLII